MYQCDTKNLGLLAQEIYYYSDTRKCLITTRSSTVTTYRTKHIHTQNAKISKKSLSIFINKPLVYILLLTVPLSEAEKMYILCETIVFSWRYLRMFMSDKATHIQ